jgi:hypothetical protein
MTDLSKRMDLKAVAKIIRETSAVPLEIGRSGKDALKDAYKKFFESGIAEFEKGALRDFGIHIGGFLYIDHENKKVDYKFFSKATETSVEEGDLGYMFPYIASAPLQSKRFGIKEWDFYIDSLFLSQREHQKQRLWSVSDTGSQDYLVPEYIAKAPFFLDSQCGEKPFLYVEFPDLLKTVIQYRRILGLIAEEPKEGFSNEWLLWRALRNKQEFLTEFEKSVLIRIDNPKHQKGWESFFEYV